MAIVVQLRIHPSVGIARMGNSPEAYYLASEFPHFMQEEFADLRLKPRPRTHPFFYIAAHGADLTGFNIFNTATATVNKFKDKGDASAVPPVKPRILPQAARFRVFAYVYDGARHPSKVFEVTPAEATIKWKVNVANKKTENTSLTPPGPDENLVPTATELDNAAATTFFCKAHGKAGFPNLAYLFLERSDADKTKVTGRLHVIGNEGNFTGSTDPAGLWSDNWTDSAADGSVEADITLISGGAPFRTKVGAASAADFKFLNHGVAGQQPGSLTAITATPGWVVIGCPDYSPDMGHFVSLWDIGFSHAMENANPSKVIDQPKLHKLIRKSTDTNIYRWTDYRIHIHPHLCLFKDVRAVSGEAFGGLTEHGATLDRGHYKHPGGTPPVGPLKEALRTAKVEFGRITIDARTRKADFEDPAALKDGDPSKSIDDWAKIAIFMRLRLPKTVYERRKFHVNDPTSLNDIALEDEFPRKFGRRQDYDKPPGVGDKNKMYQVADYDYHNGSLRDFHGLKDHGKLCGGQKSPPKAEVYPPGYDDARLALLDDHFWPATFRDMPLLRELAFTPLQYKSFELWQGNPSAVGLVREFDNILPTALQTSFGVAKDADDHFAELVLQASTVAPSIIDLAHMGSILGGSFMAGIEVGRETGFRRNWVLLEGATKYFPDVRFKPARSENPHSLGTLTKDLRHSLVVRLLGLRGDVLADGPAGHGVDCSDDTKTVADQPIRARHFSRQDALHGRVLQGILEGARLHPPERVGRVHRRGVLATIATCPAGSSASKRQLINLAALTGKTCRHASRRPPDPSERRHRAHGQQPGGLLPRRGVPAFHAGEVRRPPAEAEAAHASILPHRRAWR